jgi:hypothetical protein
LDLSVIKSFKTTWDSKLVAWQRTHVGQKLPKKEFSVLLGETWAGIPNEILSSGFKKAGIYPFNADVIPQSKYDPAALRRWISRDTNSEAQVTTPTPQREVSFEDLLLEKVRQINPAPKLKRKRVATGAEVISTEEALQRIEDLPPKKARGQKSIKQVNRNIKVQRGGKRLLRQAPVPEAKNRSEDPDPTQHCTDQNKVEIAEGKWVLVKYKTKRDTLLHYVGLIYGKNHSCGKGEGNWNIKFVKYKDGHFVWPAIEDTDTIDEEDVVRVLPVPSTDRRGEKLEFSINIDELKLN